MGSAGCERGLVETAVGRRVGRMLQHRRHHLLPLSGVRSRSGARYGLLSLYWGRRSSRLELSSIAEHGVHDDGEAPGERDPRLAHGRAYTPVLPVRSSSALCRGCQSRISKILAPCEHRPDAPGHLVRQRDGHQHSRFAHCHPRQPRSFRLPFASEPVQPGHGPDDQQAPDVGLPGLPLAPQPFLSSG